MKISRSTPSDPVGPRDFPLGISLIAGPITDTARLDWFAANPARVFEVGGRWYSRVGWQMPHKRHATLREAIDHAAGPDLIDNHCASGAESKEK